MRLLSLLTLRVQSLFGSKRLNEQLDDEIRFHLDQQIEENIAAGMSPAEARYAAMRTTGGITQIQEECRDMRRTAWFENSLQDLKYAIRGLSKTPAFTCVAILSLALGIGANTAVFSIVHAVLLRSWPYSDPARLARLIHSAEGADWSNMPEFEFVREHATAFSSVAAQQGGQDVKLALNGNVETIRITNVSTRFFETLGVPLGRGREFATAETLNGGPRAIIISAGLWRRLLQSDPSIVGRVLTIGGAGFQVAGILPESLWTPETADAFLPLRSTDEGYNTSVFTRLKPGVSLQQANSELVALTAAYRKDHPELTKTIYRIGDH